MADVPQRFKAPDKRTSLAEMAARAAQKSANRPPPPPLHPHAHSVRPPYAVTPAHSQPPAWGNPEMPGHASARTGGSGLIHLQSLQPVASSAPPLHNVDLQRMSTPPPRRARLDSNPFERRGNGFFLFMVVVVIGIGAAYGIAARRGLYPIAATKTFIGLVREWTGNGSAAQLSATEPSVPKVEAPTPAKVEAPTPPAKTNPEPVVAAAAPKAVTPDSLPPAGTSRPAAPSEPEPAAETKAAKTTVKAIQKTSAPPPAKAERPEPPVAAAPAPKPEPASARRSTGRSGTRTDRTCWRHQESSGTHRNGAEAAGRRDRTTPCSHSR